MSYMGRFLLNMEEVEFSLNKLISETKTESISPKMEIIIRNLLEINNELGRVPDGPLYKRIKD